MKRPNKPIRIDPKEVIEGLKAYGNQRFTSTPLAINDAVLSLAKRLRAGAPIYLSVEAEPNTPFNDCFNVVKARVERDGGELLYGWSLWEWPTMYIEAEHHAVWKRPDGTLIDISPRRDGEVRSLFIPDPTKVFTGRRTDNVRMAISKHWVVEDFINAAREFNQAIGNDVGYYKLTDELKRLQMYQGWLELKMRGMTPRKMVDAAITASRTPL